MKEEYNKLLERYNKAAVYMENPNVPNAEKELYLDELYKITERLGMLLDSIVDYSREEALNGFIINTNIK